MSTNQTASAPDDDFEQNAYDFLANVLGFSRNGGPFFFDCAPQEPQPTYDNFSGTGPQREPEEAGLTRFRFGVTLWATVDYADGTFGAQITKQINRMAEFLIKNGGEVGAKWAEAEAYRAGLRGEKLGGDQ